MRAKYFIIAVGILFSTLSLAVMVAEAQSNVVAVNSADRGKRSLVGIESMHVLVEVLNESSAVAESERKALDAKLHNLLSEELTVAGIPLLDAAEYKKVPNTPVLYLNVHPLKPADQNFFVVTLTLDVKQVVLLGRQQSEPLLATTWTTNGTGILPGDLAKYVPEFAAELLRRFVGDYQSANK